MSGWRMAIAFAVPTGGALFFLKLVADSLAATATELEALEGDAKKAWARRRECAEREARRTSESESGEAEIVHSYGASGRRS